MPNAAPYLPLTPPEVIGLPAFSPQVKASVRFLIVDDERTLRESCANLLQIDGYQVTVASRGQEALELLRHRRFDIVLLDLYMSDVPGYDLLRAALETSSETIVIIMTGNPSVASSVEALRLGQAEHWWVDEPPGSLRGVRYLFLTHRDDVADAAKYAERFGAERIIHRLELSAQPDAERAIDGFRPVELAPEFLAIPTPGHTRGHCALLYRKFKNTGWL